MREELSTGWQSGYGAVGRWWWPGEDRYHHGRGWQAAWEWRGRPASGKEALCVYESTTILRDSEDGGSTMGQ